MTEASPQVPEQGQLVQVRHRHYIVQDVWPGAVEPSQPPMHRVRLEALDDDQVGETLDVIWEHEVNCRVHDALGLPRPDAWDSMPRFEAFLLASRWSLSSVLMGLPLQAPFRGAIQIEDYQLEPVVRALRMPRVNLLIADDVGLGKTIEAGMVMQELLARQRIRRILVLCPASLQRQWAEEMLTKFALRFEIVDRDYTQKLRREYGIHVNPWASYPRLITSMDFLKREAPLQSFLASLHKERAGGLRDWDLLVVDEAHNAAPTGRTTYVRDSDRTHLLRQILGHFEHRLFLTATPHNGFTESFTAMLEMLDPLRFSRGPTVNKEQLAEVMVRRLKDDMVDSLGRRRFPVRHVDPLPAVVLSREERRLLDGLDQYIQTRLGRSGKMDRLPVQFALTLLKKRLLSSPLAFYRSIQVHRSHIETDHEASEEDARVVLNLKERLEEDFSDDEEKDRTEETAHAEAAGFFQVTREEMGLVVELVNLAGPAAEREDSKVEVLFDFIESHLLSDGRWNQERLLVFTEYKDTLTYLTSMLQQRGWGERVLVLHGGPATEQIATGDGMVGEDTGGIAWNDRVEREQITTSSRVPGAENDATGIARDDRVEREQITTSSRVPGAENDATGIVRGRWVDRERIKAAFRAPPDENPVRILVATDAASEGLNLQDHCRYLIHWEIPWNPNKMEQRNGRIDRHGQKAQDVFCHHFVYQGWEDQQFLDVVVDKVRTQRADLGSVGDVIAAQVEQALRGERAFIQTPDDRRRRLRDEIRSEVVTQDRIRALQHELMRARRVWHLYPDTLRLVLDEALHLVNHPGLEPVEDPDRASTGWLLRSLPDAWAECRPFITDARGRLLKLVFDEQLARDRKDATLIHLDHPLMKRALAVFRANLWSVGLHESHQLARVSYRVLADRELDRPAVLLVSRLVAISRLGHKLHEELLVTGGEIQEESIRPLDPDRLQELLDLDGQHPPLPSGIAHLLRRFFPAHERQLGSALECQVKERDKELRSQLRRRGTEEGGQVRALIDERMKEIEKRIKTMEKQMGGFQLELFDTVERDQFQRDLSWLKGRSEQLTRERETEPLAVKERYVLRDDPRAFPLCLLYLLPESLVGGGR